MESDVQSLVAALEWQIELGADEAIGDAPVDRRSLPAATPKVAPKAPEVSQTPTSDPAGLAGSIAQGAADLDGLRAAMSAFEGCDLKRGARALVFGEGRVGAPVMVIGGAPGRDEDGGGRPFLGSGGRLLDAMFSAIGLGRDDLYLTYVVPWRPPSDRVPDPGEVAAMRPFLDRHVDIVAPRVIVVAGGVAANALLVEGGIQRIRGGWHDYRGRPALPMLSPRDLIRRPEAKREAWADLLSLKARL